MSNIEFKLKVKDEKKILFVLVKSNNINFNDDEIKSYISQYKDYLINNKFSIVLDSRNLESINPRIIWEKLPLVMELSELVEKNVYCTVIITSFKMVYSLVESISKVYPNKRPFKVVKNNTDAFDFINKCNKDL